MQVCLGKEKQPSYPQGTAVTIGNFDGVHQGHRHILQRVHDQATQRQLHSVVVLFERQPQEFFARKKRVMMPYRLSPLRDKLHLLAQTQCVDAVWVLRFNQQLADVDAQHFIQQILIHQLNTHYLLVGDDFRFGKQRLGDFNLLKNQTAFETEKIPSILVDNERASSTKIRQALVGGDLVYAQSLLGHEYILSGRVKHGAKLGRTLGCPTANISLPEHHYALNGVFVVDVMGSFGRRRGVASFGFNPTVSNHHTQKLEVHIFDWHQDIYGQYVQVSFLHKLRDELKFSDINTLKKQIWVDMDMARQWIA